jgi:hypothetical protein
MGPNAGVDYSLTLCQLQSRHIHCTMGIGQPVSTLTLARVDFIHQSGTLDWPQLAERFGLENRRKTSQIFNYCRTFTCQSHSYLFYGVAVHSWGTSDKDKISYFIFLMY